jgi:3-oxoacyl-[acyl-carrier protein] reductase
MQIEFPDRIVVVTGAAMGCGRSIAQTFAALGAKVFATDIEPAGLKQTAQQSAIVTRTLDLADRAAAAAWIREIEQSTGRAVDILVNNAGGMLGQSFRPIEEVSDGAWDSIFAVNLDAAFALCRAAAPGMKRARKGRIVNIGSGASFRPSRTRIQAYCTAKHAIVGFTRQLAMELGPHGITVNSVAPGLMLTDEDKRRTWEQCGTERQAGFLASIALGRLGDPQNIADAVVFFASDLAGFVTGQVLPVNGGSF